MDHGAAHYSAIYGGVHGGATFAQMMSTTTDAAARERALFHRIAQLEAHLQQSPGTNSTQGVVKSGDGSSIQGIFEEGAKSLMDETIHGCTYRHNSIFFNILLSLSSYSILRLVI